MANLQRMLGAMLMSRMGGRGGRGMGMGGMLGAAMLGGLGGRRARRGGGGLGRKAGLAAMGYLAYRAYQKNQEQQGAAAQNAAGEQTPQASQNASSGAASGGLAGITGAIGGIIDSLSGQGARGSGQAGGSKGGSPGFGDRIGAMLDPREPEEETVEDGKALLLIRAMIAAANSDGSISPQERQRIMSQLDQAGADDEDRRIIESELQNPRSLDALLVEVKDEETAQQFYLASRMAVDGASQTQKSYLDYLRQRLNLPQDDVEEVEEMARAEGEAKPPA